MLPVTSGATRETFRTCQNILIWDLGIAVNTSSVNLFLDKKQFVSYITQIFWFRMMNLHIFFHSSPYWDKSIENWGRYCDLWFFGKTCNFYSQKCLNSRNLWIFWKKNFKIREVQWFRNTPSKFESSTAIGTHIRSSANYLNLRPREMP